MSLFKLYGAVQNALADARACLNLRWLAGADADADADACLARNRETAETEREFPFDGLCRNN